MSIPGRLRCFRRRGVDRKAQRARAFTLIELLVVVAIIAVLMSILLPSLRAAREQARAAKCSVQLRDLGIGLQNYFNSNGDWIPGINTTGASLWAALGVPGAMNQSRMPVQNFDWITPILGEGIEMKSLRADRFQEIINQFTCPSQVMYTSVLYDIPFQDKADFLNREWRPLSYLMPVHFQYWGRDYENVVISRHPLTGAPQNAAVAPTNWEAYHDTYRSLATRVGDPSRKIAASDATRYLTGTELLDFDASPWPGWFGSFTTSGGWWCGSTAFGVRPGSLNWNDHVVSAGSDPPARGKNLVMTYRHGPQRGAGDSGTCKENKGMIDALFFDGSVRRLTDRQSRNPVYWYPRGTKVRPGAQGQVMIEDVVPGDLIP